MEASEFSLDDVCDDLGPTKVIQVYDPTSGLRAVVVIDNVACGPSIGGVRMAVDVSTSEVFRLARAMSLKNAAAGLPHGGGKAGIIADPNTKDKENLLRAFARSIRDLSDYIPGPDMGTDETAMAWIQDEIDRSVGLPKVLGGIPLDQIGATGYGLARCAEVVSAFGNFALEKSTLAVEGFGSVGRHAARYLTEMGMRLVAVSDSRGAIYDSRGLDLEQLEEAKRTTGSVGGYAKGEQLSCAALFALPCDILVPAARPDVINSKNAKTIKARVILQGANIPATVHAERILHERGIVNVPDFIANAGGVICASVEYHGGTEAIAFQQIAEKIRHNTEVVLQKSREENTGIREAAIELARDRVLQAMSYRRR